MALDKNKSLVKGARKDRTFPWQKLGGLRLNPRGAHLHPNSNQESDIDKQRTWYLCRRNNNALLMQAYKLLLLCSQLKKRRFHHDVEGLYALVVAEIQRFENAVVQAGVKQGAVRDAHFVLCSLIDETVLNTPWGSYSQWVNKSLLVRFHNESCGGEKVFQMIDDFVRDIDANRDLLELLYYCLATGFEGKYRSNDQDHGQLNNIRENLYKLLKWDKGGADVLLSPRWEGFKDPRNKLIRNLPLWVVSAVSGLVLLVLFLEFSTLLNRDSQMVQNSLSKLGHESSSMVYTAPLTQRTAK